MTWRIEVGDATERLRELDAQSVQTCITSPPYWGLRDYGTATWDGGDPGCDHGVERMERRQNGRQTDVEGGVPGSLRDKPRVSCLCGATRIDFQLGLEPTPEDYVANLVAVFREVRRVLRDDGTLWLNLGDSFGSGKQLVGVPWRVAFALQADGWVLRSDVIWAKPNPMPESVTDRPTKAHEFLFLLTKQPRYFYDADAIREEHSDKTVFTYPTADAATIAGVRPPGSPGESDLGANGVGRTSLRLEQANGRNKRSVWTVSTQPYPGAHFATFPPKLIEPCVLAGSPPKSCGECGAPWERVVERAGQPPEPEHRQPLKRLEPGQAGNVGAGNMGFRTSRLSGQEMAAWKAENPDRTLGWRSTCNHDDDSGQALVLDPFAGAGTTGLVALRHGRTFVGVELNPDYAELARNRIRAWEANPAGRLEGDPEPIPGQLGLL